jgi:hypothetical protein
MKLQKNSKCLHCKGEGVIICSDGVSIDCPECDGWGM